MAGRSLCFGMVTSPRQLVGVLAAAAAADRTAEQYPLEHLLTGHHGTVPLCVFSTAHCSIDTVRNFSLAFAPPRRYLMKLYRA